MTVETLSNALSLIDDDLLENADKLRSKPRKSSRRPLWIGLAATAACAVIIGSVALKYAGTESSDMVSGSSASTGDPTTDGVPPVDGDYDNLTPPPVKDVVLNIAQADYPERTQYMEYRSDFTEEEREAYDKHSSEKRAGNKLQLEIKDEINSFATGTMEQFLSSTDGENAVYSPLNVYMAMSMLAEITDENSRQQLLDALRTESIEELRTTANKAWNSCYSDDGVVSCVISNALWLDNDIPYNEDTLNTVAENYYASSYSGEMGSEAYNTALRDWVDSNTHNLLTDSTDELGFNGDTLLAITSTTYFKAQWADNLIYKTTTAGFNAADGSTQQCEYLKGNDDRSFFWGDRFTAIRLGLKDIGGVWIILPDEGYTPEQLAADEQVQQLLYNSSDYPNSDFCSVNMKVPMFDVSDDMDIESSLKAMGVTDVFDYTKSDFSPMINDIEGYLGAEQPYISKAQHSTRVSIDEIGCTGASYVEFDMNPGAGPSPDKKAEFIADRPFMFAVTSYMGIPIYCGIVNTME